MSDSVGGLENLGIISLVGRHSSFCVFSLFLNMSAHSTLRVCSVKKHHSWSQMFSFHLGVGTKFNPFARSFFTSFDRSILDLLRTIELTWARLRASFFSLRLFLYLNLLRLLRRVLFRLIVKLVGSERLFLACLYHSQLILSIYFLL